MKDECPAVEALKGSLSSISPLQGATMRMVKAAIAGYHEWQAAHDAKIRAEKKKENPKAKGEGA